MDFTLSDEHRAIAESVRKFAKNELEPIAHEIDETDLFPTALIKKMGELGFMGLPYPEELGGSDAGWLAFVLALEELNRINSAAALEVCTVALSGSSFFLFGTDEQKQRYLAPFIKGEAQCAFASTEPGAGSDAGGIKTTARLEDGHWVINGSKSFITNAGSELCVAAVATAVTGKREGGKKEISQIIVPTGTPGYEVGKRYHKIGWKGVDTREIFFDDCKVPEANLLGQRGGGLRQALTSMSTTRVCIAAMAVGLAQGCFDYSLSYAKEREAFGQSISKFQAIQHKLADMAAEVEAARLMTYKAATLLDQKGNFAHAASLAKLFAAEVAVKATNEAVCIHGGYGCVREYQVARFLGDAKILQIGEGTPEIQRLVIARDLEC